MREKKAIFTPRTVKLIYNVVEIMEEKFYEYSSIGAEIRRREG